MLIRPISEGPFHHIGRHLHEIYHQKGKNDQELKPLHSICPLHGLVQDIF